MSLRGTAKPGQYLTGSINKVTYQIISAYGVAVKNGFKGTEEEWLLSLQANPDLVKHYVTEYLSENPVATDATLSQTSMAADAKATGEAIQNAKNEATNESKAYTDTHINTRTNPHGVTKSQVGLGNVDNTSDMDKPVSTAQASAIANAKKAGTDAEFIAISAKQLAEVALPMSGGIMSGGIEMDGNVIGGLRVPILPDEAASKEYVDRKRVSNTLVLLASAWSHGVQTIFSDDFSHTDMPHWGVVYSDNASTREAEKEAFALVDEAETSNGRITFRCFGNVPTVDLTIQWEVNR